MSDLSAHAGAPWYWSAAPAAINQPVLRNHDGAQAPAANKVVSGDLPDDAIEDEHSALTLMCHLDVSWKTAWQPQHKLMEVMAQREAESSSRHDKAERR